MGSEARLYWVYVPQGFLGLLCLDLPSIFILLTDNYAGGKLG